MKKLRDDGKFLHTVIVLGTGEVDAIPVDISSMIRSYI